MTSMYKMIGIAKFTTPNTLMKPYPKVEQIHTRKQWIQKLESTGNFEKEEKQCTNEGR